MKYNDKCFYQVKGMPFDIQEMNDGSTTELYYLEEQPFFNMYLKRGQFTTWTFVNNQKYRVLVEKGYYEVGEELYTKEVNEIWIEFWKTVDKKSKIFTLAILLPIMFAYIAIIFTVYVLVLEQMWFLLVGVLGMLVISTVARSVFNKKLEKENILAANKIREKVGVEKFTTVVDAQNKYIEDYYANLQAEYERLDREEQEAFEREQKALEEGESSEIENNDSIDVENDSVEIEEEIEEKVEEEIEAEFEEIEDKK